MVGSQKKDTNVGQSVRQCSYESWIVYGFFGHEKSWNWTSVLKVMKKILHLSNVVLKNQQVNNFCNVISLLKVEILLHLIIWLLAKNISGGTYCVVFCYQRWPRRMYCTWWYSRSRFLVFTVLKSPDICFCHLRGNPGMRTEVMKCWREGMHEG